MSHPAVGRIVQYALSEVDVEIIGQRRSNRSAYQGNTAVPGQSCPAMIVRTFGATTVNLQVFLDGDDQYWATSRAEGDKPGTWAWPKIV